MTQTTKRHKKLWAVATGRKGNMDIEIHKSIKPPKVTKETVNIWSSEGRPVDFYSTNKWCLTSECPEGFRKATGIKLKLGEVRELIVRVK